MVLFTMTFIAVPGQIIISLLDLENTIIYVWNRNRVCEYNHEEITFAYAKEPLLPITAIL